jgi:hypothetical protein
MRYKSPAHPDELRAVSPEPTAATVRRRSNVSPLNVAVASGRITIRPLAGAAVGTLSTTMVSFDWVVDLKIFIIIHASWIFFFF